nr:MAG TPA: hypothetical protein [Caudoviricetes sp.]
MTENGEYVKSKNLQKSRILLFYWEVPKARRTSNLWNQC